MIKSINEGEKRKQEKEKRPQKRIVTSQAAAGHAPPQTQKDGLSVLVKPLLYSHSVLCKKSLKVEVNSKCYLLYHFA